MKKIKYLLFALPLVYFSSCSEEVGTDPGTDTNPVVTMYSYTPELADGVNPDNDVLVRFATNSAVNGLYYLVENEEAYNNFFDQKGAGASEAYMEKVVSEGTKIDVNGAQNIDKIVGDIHEAVVITGVATNGSVKTMANVKFTGLDWTKICSGEFVANNFFGGSRICDLEICTTDKNLYHIKDAFKEGYSLKFTLMGLRGAAQGMYFYPVRVPEAQTGFSLNFQDGSSSALWVIDVAGWQGDSSFATNSNYWSIMYDDYFCEFNLAWMTDQGCVAYGSAGDGSGNTSFFVPAE